jgi:hypothetical protein
MSSIHEKRLYAPEAINPGNNIADLLDAANKSTNLANIQYKTAFPDFSNAVALSQNTIYHVNAPGWLFRAPNGTLSTSGTNGVIIQGQSHQIDVYAIPFKEMAKGGSLQSPKITTNNDDEDGEYRYAAPSAQAVKKDKTADVSATYGVLFFPKRFEDDFTQTNRLVYVTYSDGGWSGGGHACQMIPILPSNPTNEDEHKETIITYVAAKGNNARLGDGVHTTSATVETRGMYIMHCTSTGISDTLIFVPAKCSNSFTNYVTLVRSALSKCNLDMYTTTSLGTGKATAYAITNTAKDGSSGGVCGDITAATIGKYTNLTVYCYDTDTKTVHYALPTDNGNGINAIVYGHGHEASFCDCWKEIFKGGTPDIEGRKASFKAYVFGSLDTIPIPGKESNKLTKKNAYGQIVFPSEAKPKWGDINFANLFELSNTTSLSTFSVS